MASSSLAPQVSATGIVGSDYANILAQLINAYQSIYGADAVLDNSTQDGQLLAVFAQAIYDTSQACVAVFNSFSPLFAQGVQLSSLVKLNGLLREASSNSTVTVTVVGTVGTVINGGLIGDNVNLNTVWALPTTVTIPSGGTIDVTATCTATGAVSAAPNTLTVILSPVAGWQTVNNASAAALGAPVESDAQLRERQSASTALPALSLLESLFAQVANLPGVQRVAAYENDTDATNATGLPPHSICFVVLGGNATTIAQTLANGKGQGVNTFGSTTVQVIDQNGVPINIHFYILTTVTITVTITLRALSGYTATIGDYIQQAVAAFISNLAIGEYSYVNRLFGPANLDGDVAVNATGQNQTQLDVFSATYNILSITQSRAGSPADTTVTGGPYNAGTMLINVTSAADMYAGQTIAFVMDNAALFTVVIQSIAVNAVTLVAGVPVGRNVPTGASVYLVSDLKIAFNEAAVCGVANVTVNQA